MEEEDVEEDNLEWEPWVDFIQRSTRIAESVMKKANISDWVVEHRRKLWRFAGHTARRTDGRWNHELLLWTPPRGFRYNWRPELRWADPLDRFWKGSDWTLAAKDRTKWAAMEEVFVRR